MQTILASKVQLRISYYQCHFVFSDMSNIAVKTHTIHAVWCQVGYNILLDSIRIESTDGNFGTHEKAAIPIPILTCTLPIPLCSHSHGILMGIPLTCTSLLPAFTQAKAPTQFSDPGGCNAE